MTTKWEYTAETMTLKLLKKKTRIDKLNSLGDEGWEAVAMHRYVIGIDDEDYADLECALILFKRPRT